MHITLYTDYSLRVLMYIALKGEELSTIREIAASYDISRNHLMKVVQELNNKGYLTALRGKNGGLRLNGRPEDINIGALVRDTERDIALVECLGEKNRCVITPACQLSLYWRKPWKPSSKLWTNILSPICSHCNDNRKSSGFCI